MHNNNNSYLKSSGHTPLLFHSKLLTGAGFGAIDPTIVVVDSSDLAQCGCHGNAEPRRPQSVPGMRRFGSERKGDAVTGRCSPSAGPQSSNLSKTPEGKSRPSRNIAETRVSDKQLREENCAKHAAEIPPSGPTTEKATRLSVATTPESPKRVISSFPLPNQISETLRPERPYPRHSTAEEPLDRAGTSVG